MIAQGQGILDATSGATMDFCPNVSIQVQVRFGELESIIGLKYQLDISSSMGCELEECPLLLRTEQENWNFFLRDDVNYTVTLMVLNDCGSDRTTVTIHPQGKYLFVRMCHFSLSTLVCLFPEVSHHI